MLHATTIQHGQMFPSRYLLYSCYKYQELILRPQQSGQVLEVYVVTDMLARQLHSLRVVRVHLRSEVIHFLHCMSHA